MLDLASHCARADTGLPDSVATSPPMRNDALVFEKAVAINWSHHASAHGLSSL
jgi:hypothetical protein